MADTRHGDQATAARVTAYGSGILRLQDEPCRTGRSGAALPPTRTTAHAVILAPAGEEFVRRLRDRRNMLGAVQQTTLPRLGFVPEGVPAAPAAVVARLPDL